ncbi:MAG: ATP-grasp domain-containing protein, partial [Elusimicrobia bacterium]|nr:ATP-grasp domain-containing protein [Elusimicrobiota bacterium]
AAFNKVLSQRIFEEAGVLVPRTVVVRSHSFDVGRTVELLGGYPLVVKPACEGSSIGVVLAGDEPALKEGVAQALTFGGDVLIQEHVQGREMTVGILGQAPLPVVEVVAEKSFFDFEAKYQARTTRYDVPARLSEPLAAIVQAEALKAYRALGCDGFGRADVILTQDHRPFVLEVNTIPGFTQTSLLPKAARAAGLDFSKLCLTLVDMSYGKKKTAVETADHKS